jgi:hypothetical protein
MYVVGQDAEQPINFWLPTICNHERMHAIANSEFELVIRNSRSPTDHAHLSMRVIEPAGVQEVIGKLGSRRTVSVRYPNFNWQH